LSPRPRSCIATENPLLELSTGEFTVHGYAFTFEPAQSDAINSLVASLATSLPGQNVERVREARERLRHSLDFVRRMYRGAQPDDATPAGQESRLSTIVGRSIT
jgi:hypothetical protein